MLDFWVWLYSQPKIGSKTVKCLVQNWGQDVDWGNAVALGRRLTNRMISGKEIEGEIEMLANALLVQKVGVMPFWDSRYPKLLKQIPDYPAFLFYCGQWRPELFDKCVGVVGTRRMSEYGRNCIEQIIPPLVATGVTIVSGLAVGVDAFAHNVALRSKNTCCIAVLAGGPTNGFPTQNTILYKKIIEQGIIVSEFLPNTSITAGLFANRNRIIAGLSSGTIVVEAPEKSGALITAQCALDYNREVLAVPGNIFSDVSKGTNELIKQGAHVVTNGNDVFGVLGWGEHDAKQLDLDSIFVKHLAEGFEVSCDKMRSILPEITERKIGIDNLCNKLGKDPTFLAMCLTRFELEGILSQDGNGGVMFSMPSFR